jgi:hypothetical protein
VLRKIWAKNSPTKNYPLSAKKNLGEELSGEELFASRLKNSPAKYYPGEEL